MSYQQVKSTNTCNWVGVIDPKSKRPYYVHKRTKVTTWIMPEGFVPEPWHLVEKDGKKFYVNTETRETAWEPEFMRAARLERERRKEAAVRRWRQRKQDQEAIARNNAELRQREKMAREQEEAAERERLEQLEQEKERSLQEKIEKHQREKEEKQRQYKEQIKQHKAEEKRREKERKEKEAELRRIQEEEKALEEFLQQSHRRYREQAEQFAESLDMLEYGANNFDLRKYKFGRDDTPESVLQFSSKLITRSITRLSEQLQKLAIQCNKNITGFMGDRKSSKDECGHAVKLLENGRMSDASLRDEIYVQVVRQLYNNDRPDSVHKGWKLIALCTMVFPPSNELVNYLVGFIYNEARAHSQNADLARFALWQIDEVRLLAPLTLDP
ncbi:MAG: hypothetical protein MHM6MM_005624 [Cercozoa sp. M6MM]